MATQLRSISRMVRGERPTLTGLILEMIALRHQIAVLERSGTRRSCFRLRDRLFWILLARWWSGWRDSLVNRPARDSLALAPRRLVRAVAISVAWSLARSAESIVRSAS
jgi:hypothetical protein